MIFFADPEEAIRLSAGPVGSSLDCILHTHGQFSSPPHPFYSEEHHVIPRDWQDEFQPAVDVPTPYRPQRSVLWDSRTVPCCRTGHGNIHFLLVLLMKRWEAVMTQTPTWQQSADNIAIIRRQVVENLRVNEGWVVNGQEVEIAEQAMQRWNRYGLELMGLCRNGSYGRI